MTAIDMIEKGVFTDTSAQEMELNKEKSIAKSMFTLHRSRLLLMIEEQDIPGSEFYSACRKMDSQMESAIEVMSKLSDTYMRGKKLDKVANVVNEMEIIEREFHYVYDTVFHSWNLHKKDKSYMTQMEFLNKQGKMEASGSFRNCSEEETPTGQSVNKGSKQNFEPYGDHSIGTDLWSEIPTFSGDKRSYRSWKTAFMACVDTVPATDEYKLLHLRQCLSGEALNVIENLGHSAAAYEADKERLERRYGGKRRQVGIYLNDLDNFPKVKPGNVQDIQKFADLLEIAIMNLQETGHQNELGNGFLYAKLQTKLTESMLARYHRWVFETQSQESVYALKTWVFQESEFQTIASETVHGISSTIGSACSKLPEDSPALGTQTTFFGATMGHHHTKNVNCHVCGEGHSIEACQLFMKKDVPGRWIAAKRLKLCFRCLENGHLGKTCQKSRLCGQRGCQKLHHTLLHKSSKRYVLSKSEQTNTSNNALGRTYIETNYFYTDPCTSDCTEGNDHTIELPAQKADVYTCTCTTGVKGMFTSVSDLSTKSDRRLKVDNVGPSPCTRTQGYEFGNSFKSKINVNDRDALSIRRKSTSLADSEDVEFPRCPMAGNYTINSSKFIKILV